MDRLCCYKIYKIICKKLHCEALGYDCLTKAARRRGAESEKVIWAEVTYGPGKRRVPLFVEVGGKSLSLKLGKRAERSEDVQKEIVKRILLALKKHAVCAGSYKIARGTEFEAELVKFDLSRGIS